MEENEKLSRTNSNQPTKILLRISEYQKGKQPKEQCLDKGQSEEERREIKLLWAGFQTYRVRDAEQPGVPGQRQSAGDRKEIRSLRREEGRKRAEALWREEGRKEVKFR